MLKVAVHFLYCCQLKGIDQRDRLHQCDFLTRESFDVLLKSQIDAYDDQYEVTLMCYLFSWLVTPLQLYFGAILRRLIPQGRDGLRYVLIFHLQVLEQFPNLTLSIGPFL